MNSVYGALDISTRSIRQATQKKPVGVKGATLTGFLGRVGTESSLSSTSSVVSGTRQGQELHLRLQVGRTDTWCAATALPCRALPPTYGGTQLWALSPILSTFPCGLYRWLDGSVYGWCLTLKPQLLGIRLSASFCGRLRCGLHPLPP